MLLAEKLKAMAPFDAGRVFYGLSGSDANDTQVKLMWYYNNAVGRPEKKKIISRKKGYHGVTVASGSLTGLPPFHNAFDLPLPHVLHTDCPHYYSEAESGETEAEFVDRIVNSLEDLILREGADTIAAFIAEPILGAGGVIVPPPGYHQKCLEVCRRHDVLYISDEVVTGFGRLGHYFSSEAVFGIVPDIITCAKGLTSGYVPLGAVLISDRLLSQVSGPGAKDAIFSNGFTYSGHPVSCAAALANLDVIEREGLLAHARTVGPHLQHRLQELLDLPIVGDVRGAGLMACVECVVDKDSKDPLMLDHEIGNRIDRHCQKLGLLVRPLINMCVMSPPLIITEAQIDQLASLLRAGIERATRDVQAEGLFNPASSATG